MRSVADLISGLLLLAVTGIISFAILFCVMYFI